MQVGSTKTYLGKSYSDVKALKPTETVTKFSGLSNGTLTVGSNPNLVEASTKNSLEKSFLKTLFSQRNKINDQTSIYFKYKSAKSSNKDETKFNNGSLSNANLLNENDHSIISLLPLGNLKNNNSTSTSLYNSEKNKMLPKISETLASQNNHNYSFISSSTNNLIPSNESGKLDNFKVSMADMDTDINSILSSFYGSKSTNSAKSLPIKSTLGKTNIITKEELTLQQNNNQKNENLIEHQNEGKISQNLKNNKNFLTPNGNTF
jgi:Ni,Fe-hydrogenase I large subunit